MSIPVTPNATTGWVDGTFHFQYGTNCIVIGSPYEENMITSFAGYWGSSDATYPAVGDVYYGRVFVSIPGNACIDGITDALIYVNLPTNTYLYSDSQNSIRCYWKGSTSGIFQDVTSEPNARCQANPVYYPGYGYYMAWPLLAQGAQFYVQFPIYSTVRHSGISDSGSRLLGRVESSDTPTSSPSQLNNNPQFPDQWVFVAANPPTIGYPSPSTSLITNTTARTTANLNNHFTSGTLYFDLGTTTAYGDATPTSIPNTTNSQTAWVDWGGLLAGTLYHWRARFVVGVTTYTGVDQTFTTTGTPATPRRTRADFNADNKSDVIWRKSTTGENAMWLMDGVAISSPVLLPPVSDTNWKMAGVGDFDGDLKADVIWLHGITGQVAIWLMNGTSLRSGTVVATVSSTNWKIVGVGDVDNNGRSDVLWRNVSTGQNLVWLMNGNTISGSAYLPTIADLNWSVAGVGDFNADGRSDLFWRNGSTLQNVIWLMNGASVGSALFTTTVSDANYKVVGAGDADNDGKADVVWWNQATGDVVLWIMNGAVVSSAGLITRVSDLNWHVEGVGDFDGDAKVDLLWRKADTGDAVVWLMNGLVLRQATFVTRVSDLNWSVVAPR